MKQKQPTSTSRKHVRYTRGGNFGKLAVPPCSWIKHEWSLSIILSRVCCARPRLLGAFSFSFVALVGLGPSCHEHTNVGVGTYRTLRKMCASITHWWMSLIRWRCAILEVAEFRLLHSRQKKSKKKLSAFLKKECWKRLKYEQDKTLRKVAVSKEILQSRWKAFLRRCTDVKRFVTFRFLVLLKF